MYRDATPEGSSGDALQTTCSNTETSFLSLELADALYRAQCATLSIDPSGRPLSTQADLHMDHVWFNGLSDYLRLLTELAKQGYLIWGEGNSFTLTEKGIRACVTSPGFTAEQIADRQVFLDRAQGWFVRQDEK